MRYYSVFMLLTMLLVCSILYLYHRVYHHDLEHLKQQVMVSMNLVAGKVSQDVSRDLNAMELELVNLSRQLSSVDLRNPKQEKALRESLQETLTSLDRYQPLVVACIDSDGRSIRVGVPGVSAETLAMESFDRNGVAKAIVDVALGPEQRGKMLVITQSLTVAAGDVMTGKVIAGFDLEGFLLRYGSGIDELYFWLMKKGGEIVYYPQEIIGFGTDGARPVPDSMARFMAGLEKDGIAQGEYLRPDGLETLGVGVSVSGFGKDLFLVFASPVEQVKSLIKHFHTDHLVLTLVIVLSILSGSLFLLNTIIGWNRTLRKEIDERIVIEKQNQELICELEQALSEIKVLSGFLPICAWCKKIRDDKGYWNQVEVYLSEHAQAQFSHGICPDCRQEMQDEMTLGDRKKKEILDG